MSNDPPSRGQGSPHPKDRGLRLRMASEARRVHSQHEQLATLIEDLGRTFAGQASPELLRSAFEQFADAFDAHMRVEETLYFPALHGLLPEVDAELTALIAEHAELRAALDGIRHELGQRQIDDARTRLTALAERRATHEAVEERLIERVRRETGT